GRWQPGPAGCPCERETCCAVYNDCSCPLAPARRAPVYTISEKCQRVVAQRGEHGGIELPAGDFFAHFEAEEGIDQHRLQQQEVAFHIELGTPCAGQLLFQQVAHLAEDGRGVVLQEQGTQQAVVHEDLPHQQLRRPGVGG